MNPQTVSDQPNPQPQTEVPAPTQSADNGWTNIPPRPVKPEQPKVVSKKKKVLIIVIGTAVVLAITAGLVMFIQDMRADAAQAKLQRESRIVVL